MKKALLLTAILLISVLTTACINNFAIQELNTKAKDYMEQGDYQNAIERLKSSIDLDNSIFESHYNLAVAYTKNEDYSEAIKAYDDALKINPEFADAYYSLAVCEENLAKDMISGLVKVDENNNFIKLTQDEIMENSGKNKELTAEEKIFVVDLLKKSIEDYQTYLDKTEDKTSTQDVNTKINELNDLITKNTSAQK